MKHAERPYYILNGSLIMFFTKFKNNILLNSLAWLWTIWKESIQEKGTQSTQFGVQGVKIIFILFKCHRSSVNTINFYHFILSWKDSWQQRIQLCKCKISSWITNHNPLRRTLSTWDKLHFWIYLLNRNSWSDQTWLFDRYKQGQ